MPCTEDLNSWPAPQPVAGIGRRGFLTLTAAAATASLPAVAASHGPATGAGLSVAYLADGPAAAGLRSAHALVAGDADFVHRGVRLSVLGLGGKRSPDLQGVALLTHNHVPGLAQPVDVVHWGMRVRPVECSGCDSEQVVPLGADASLKLSVELRHTTQTHKQVFPVELTSGWRPGAAKLKTGTYLLAFDFGKTVPSWASHALQPGAEGDAVQLAASDFTYLVVKVDYAS